MVKLSIVPEDHRPIVDQVVGGLWHLIESRCLPAGRKLPSIRAFASENGISKSTVVEAFDRLVARGALVSKHKVGFFVAGQRPALDLSEKTLPAERDIDPLWMLRRTLQSAPDVVKPGCGWLPDDWLNAGAPQRALRTLARSPQARLLAYGQPLGYAPLRAHLQMVFADRGIEVTPNRILITDSATQAIDLVGRLLVQPGDTVFVDDPCYFNTLGNLRVHRARVVGIPYRNDGPDLEAFATEAARHRPRLYITNSALHNPTGATLTAAVAHRLLKLAEAFDVAILEDDIYADFEEQPSPRLASLDQLHRVISVGSYSKTLSAATRCGWIAARADWIEGLIDLKLTTALSSNEVAAQMMYQLLTDGSYRKHVECLRSRLRAASVPVRRQLERCGLKLWTEPAAGMFLWAMLPEGLCSATIARIAAGRGIAMAPGNVFSVSHSAGRFLRFNVAQSHHERIWAFLAETVGAGQRLGSLV